MTKLAVVAMLMWSAVAHAEVMADGTIAPTGNATADLAVAGFNVYRKAMNMEMEYTKFVEQRADILAALAKKTAAARGGREALPKLKADLVTEENAAKKLRDTEVRDARGDKTKEAAAEAKYTTRKEQIESARSKIDGAGTEMKRVYDMGEQLRKNLEAIDTRDSVNGTKQWAELRKQNVTVQAKMTESTKKVDAALTSASTALQQGSTVNKAELAGAFKVKVKLTGSKTELYVNGTKVVDGGELGVGKDGKIELRAELIDARRKQARQYKGKAGSKVGSISITAADDYHLAYSNGTKSSDWAIDKETYEWKPAEGRISARLGLATKSSGNGVKNDIYEITIPADTYSETIRGYVSGEIAWKGPTVDSDAEGASYELQIMPAK